MEAITSVTDGITTDYYPAGADCLVIFTGRGGDTKGYADKYVKIARRAVEDYRFSVLAAGVPQDIWSRPQAVFTAVVNLALSKHPSGKIYLMGSSAGASLALWYAHMYPRIERVLAVNPVLNLNFHRTREGLEKFGGEKIHIAVGGLDPCAVWAELLPEAENTVKEIIAGADHVFGGRLEEFIALPFEKLFDDAGGRT